jgi:hypothetical protein
MKTISTQFGSIIGLGIDLNLFYSINVSINSASLLGNYSNELEAYLLENGFEYYNYLYADSPDWIEFTKDGCRIALDKR